MGYDGTGATGSRWRRLPSFARFVVVGGVNTLFGYGAYALFLWLGFHFASAALLGTLAGIVFNFFTTGRFVFDGSHDFRRLPRFVGTYVVIYLINVGSIAALVRLGLSPYTAGFVLVAPMAFVSFVLMRRVFRPAHARH